MKVTKPSLRHMVQLIRFKSRIAESAGAAGPSSCIRPSEGVLLEVLTPPQAQDGELAGSSHWGLSLESLAPRAMSCRLSAVLNVLYDPWACVW